MKLDEIKDLLKAVSQSDVNELEVTSGKDHIRIRRGPDPDAQPPYVVVSSPAVGAPVAPAAAPAAVAPPAAAPPAEAASDSDEDDGLIMVKSPIVGTFYEASAPNAPAFVEIGDTVAKGQVLCIIEAMKLMNEIEAESAGVVAKRFVTNGQPIEYGEALFALKPA